MSTTPPTRYYASRPSSPPTPTSADQAAVRSQAIAKLKRAASLPRQPDGRRPAQPQTQQQTTPHRDYSPSRQAADPSSSSPPSASPLPPSSAPIYSAANAMMNRGDEEVLAHSPDAPTPLSGYYTPSGIPSAGSSMGMQRSASATSSFDIPSPPQLYGASTSTSPFYTAANSPAGTPDWAAMQLAQSYLPSLSPAAITPTQLTTPPSAVGRNTPSPLPTLGELGALSRSNSAAARAKAMSKLTGGREDPSPRQDDEDEILAMSARSKLHRADTIGAIRAFTPQAAPIAMADAPADADDDGAVEIGHRPVTPGPMDTPLLPRPRLQRSFTVSSSNMGEERRSAVGRRMVARLAERKAARDQEGDEVRKLWEERRGQAVQNGQTHQDDDDDIAVEEDGDETPALDHLGVAIPRLERTSPEQLSRQHLFPGNEAELLAHPDRAISRNTQRSADDAFEYEAHLRRSMSSRTARNELADVHPHTFPSPALDDDTTPVPPHPTSGVFDDADPVPNLADGELKAPNLPFVTPSKRQGTHSSTSSQATIQGDNSPGGDSSVSGDAFNSMMFVIGSGPSALSASGGVLNRSWPSEVGENGASDWGTPSKVSDTDPMSHAVPLGEDKGQDHEHEHEQVADAEYLPRDSTDSAMSWEEVGGVEDREIPSDSRYLAKSGSVGARMGRAVKTAMRKGSQKRDSAGTVGSSTSPPTSPRQLVNAVFARRSSQSSSLSPSQASFAPSISRGAAQVPASVSSTSSPPILNPRHQPSVSSLAPSITTGPDASSNASASASASANSILLQHQLASAEPSPVSFVPRAGLSDPRIHSSKLSPFPGIAVQPRAASLEPTSTIVDEAPKLLHQLSDSVVPSSQRVQQPVEPIYSLPAPVVGISAGGATGVRRESTDSATKRGWLARAFGQGSTRTSASAASGSGSLSRSNSDQGHEDGRRDVGAYSSDLDKDPFAAPAPAYAKAIPGTYGQDNGVQPTGMLPLKSMSVLSRMDDVLALAPDDPARPDFLDDPPRKLLLATQVLQVVNVHTVKDRYLFLFNDVLVIAKPLITHGITATLDMKFIVKSVVGLDKLVVSGISEEPTTEPPRHPIVDSFIQQFAQEPLAAVRYLVERSNPRVDVATVSSLIFKTPELDKTQIGNLLAGNEALLRAFVDRFPFAGVRIDDALRMFLLSLRLPNDPPAASEALLRGFADGYFHANMDHIAYNRETTGDLVLAILELNDSFHSYAASAATSRSEFAFTSHPPLSRDAFISGFTAKDPQGHVAIETLDEIYRSIGGSPLVQALGRHDTAASARDVKMVPAKLPSKLTYNVWSDPISIILPQPDSQFSVRLFGAGLEFDPPELEFAGSNEQSFRVKGTSLGVKSLLFDRRGANAALYAAIGNTRSFSVERAFMRHTFHVAFVSHLGLKRKYCFSVNDLATRRKWAAALTRQIRITAASNDLVGPNSKVRRAAEAVSLQVLRDALIPPEEGVGGGTNASANGVVSVPLGTNASSSGKANGTPKLGGTSGTTSTSGAAAGNSSGAIGSTVISSTPSKRTPSTRMNRSGSVSVAYAHQAGAGETDLGPLQATRAHNTEANSGLVDVQTGKELVLLCRQNSLLPGLLELLQGGIEEGTEANRAANLRARMQGKRV